MEVESYLFVVDFMVFPGAIVHWDTVRTPRLKMGQTAEYHGESSWLQNQVLIGS